MKQLLPILLSGLISVAALAQNSPEGAGGYVRIPKGSLDGKEVPQFYMSANEITNKQYRDFLQALRAAGDTARLKVAMTDSTLWFKLPDGHIWAETYFQNPAYNDFPVLNISKRAAVLYCEWLTQNFKKRGKPGAYFTLPTETQWEYAALGGNPKAVYPWEWNSTKCQKKGKYYNTYLCNYYVAMDSIHPKMDTTKSYSNATLTAITGSYLPNGYGLYNMSGNAAELLVDKNYTKGGSWHSPAEKVKIASHEDNDPAVGSPFVGFRPVLITSGP